MEQNPGNLKRQISNGPRTPLAHAQAHQSCGGGEPVADLQGTPEENQWAKKRSDRIHQCSNYLQFGTMPIQRQAR